MATFYELDLHQEVIRGLQQMGFEEATPIQEEIIPFAKAGRDVIGQAQTGTGKTAAFGIPMIEKIDLDEKQIQGLVLTPTRELAIQVAEELNKIARYRGIRALPVYGGQDINRQIKALKNRPQIIVATPGRFMDHMRRKTIRLQGIHTVVLDEADEMLSMGFIEDIELILKDIPEQRQTLLFSATMPHRLQAISEAFMVEPEIVKIKTKEMTVPSIDQYYLEVPERQKFDTLCRLLDMQSPELAIIFGRTKRRVDELNEALKQRGYEVEGIHGDLKQSQRDNVIGKFKRGIIDILVATDVAARGLDITGVSHVFNFDLPQNPESYVHRIGRTGRAGKTGVAYTFASPREIDHLKAIERATHRKMERKAVPSFADAIEGRYKQAMEKLQEALDQEFDHQLKHMASNLLDEYDAVTLVSAALKSLTKETNQVQVQLTEEAPLRVKKKPEDRRNRSPKQAGGFGGQKRGGFGKKRTERSSDFKRSSGNKGKRSKYSD